MTLADQPPGVLGETRTGRIDHLSVRDQGLGEQAGADEPEDFKPTGTIFILGMFVVALVLLWLSVYVILLSRGVTV